MVAQYTAETVKRIKRWVREGYTPGAAAFLLGWKMEYLKRVCDLHGIEFPKPAQPQLPPPVFGDMRWDGEKAWRKKYSVTLPPVEGRLFATILRSDGYAWNAEQLAERCEVPNASVRTHLSMLRRNLKLIGVELSERTYQLKKIKKGRSYKAPGGVRVSRSRTHRSATTRSSRVADVSV